MSVDSPKSEWEEYIEKVEKEDHKTRLRVERYYKKKNKARAKRKRTGR